jgi:hypothetical protein
VFLSPWSIHEILEVVIAEDGLDKASYGLLIHCLLCNFGQWPTGGKEHLNALIRQGDSLSPYSFVLLCIFFSFFFLIL